MYICINFLSSEVFCSPQLGALHEVLERLQTKRINPWEKKYGQVPSVSVTHTEPGQTEPRQTGSEQTFKSSSDGTEHLDQTPRSP